MTAVEFERYVLQLFYNDIHQLEQNNYAAERYSYDGVDRSGLFDVAKHVGYLDWFTKNYEQIFLAIQRLADDESRALLINLIRYRLAGHLHVRINSRVQQVASDAQRFRATFVGGPSRFAATGMFGELLHYDQDWNGERYVVDTIKDSLIATLVYRQYYFERNGVRVAPELGDHLIDGGACTGDTAVVFAKSVGATGRVYAFDPVKNHVDILKENFSRPGFENVTIFPQGLSDKTVDAPPIDVGTYSPGWRVGDGEVPLVRIDDLVMRGEIERVDFIKLDVEGSELAALRGALSSIHRFRPKLAISIYHKPNDYFELLNFIYDQQLGYRFYLDHHTIWDEETVLYAIR